MPTEVFMPKVDMDMASGKVAAWHVAEGERVEKGAPLFDIETDKAAMEVESPASGVLRHVSAAVGSEAPIGAVLAWIYAEGEADAPPPAAAPASAEPEPQRTPLSPERPHAEIPGGASADRPRATPAARRLARDAGVDLRLISGAGPRGRIQAADVAARLERPTGGPVEQRSKAAASQDWTPETGPLFMLESGAGGETPLLLLHGFAADGYAWAALEPHLPGGRRVLKLELPSHGRSPKRRILSFAALSRSIVEAVDQAGLTQAHIVGHSLGGALALALADIRPRLAASLTLIAPGGLGPEIDGDLINGLARASRAASLAPWLRRLTADRAFFDDAFVSAAMAARAQPELRAAQIDLADTLFPDGVQSFDLRPALERVAAPTALIWGRADRVLPWRQALSAPGRAALHLLADVGHTPHLEAPELVGALISRHIAGATLFAA